MLRDGSPALICPNRSLTLGPIATYTDKNTSYVMLAPSVTPEPRSLVDSRPPRPEVPRLYEAGYF